jgi:hypothetical protein
MKSLSMQHLRQALNTNHLLDKNGGLHNTHTLLGKCWRQRDTKSSPFPNNFKHGILRRTHAEFHILCSAEVQGWQICRVGQNYVYTVLKK